MTDANDFRIWEPITPKQDEASNFVFLVVLDVSRDLFCTVDVKLLDTRMSDEAVDRELRHFERVSALRIVIRAEFLSPSVDKAEVATICKDYRGLARFAVQFDEYVGHVRGLGKRSN
jgi:hypothetical protein